jgi:transcriptional regulator with XRE-family HTH domain
MPVVSTFARRVRQRRAELGLSQEALAELSGLDRTYISGIERGVRNPTLSTAEKLAGALGVPLAWLVTARD